jgi:hypothetical protein
MKFRFPDAEFFVGAKDKMEMQKIPQAGFQIRVCGLRFTKENKFTKFDVSFSAG